MTADPVTSDRGGQLADQRRTELDRATQPLLAWPTCEDVNPPLARLSAPLRRLLACGALSITVGTLGEPVDVLLAHAPLTDHDRDVATRAGGDDG